MGRGRRMGTRGRNGDVNWEGEEDRDINWEGEEDGDINWEGEEDGDIKIGRAHV